jgi:hypothetical protein
MRKANIVTAMVLDGEPLRPEGTYSATGDERGVLASTSRRDDGHGLKPSGQPCADVARSGSCTLSYEKGEHTGERKRQELKIGTWNVRTMNLKGKLENVKEEMKRNNLNVLGVSEVRWIGDGDFVSDQYRVIYAGGEERQRGVAIILDSDAGKRVFDIKRCGDRIIMIKMHGELANIVLIQVYMPTSEHSDDKWK